MMTPYQLFGVLLVLVVVLLVVVVLVLLVVVVLVLVVVLVVVVVLVLVVVVVLVEAGDEVDSSVTREGEGREGVEEGRSE